MSARLIRKQSSPHLRRKPHSSGRIRRGAREKPFAKSVKFSTFTGLRNVVLPGDDWLLAGARRYKHTTARQLSGCNAASRRFSDASIPIHIPVPYTQGIVAHAYSLYYIVSLGARERDFENPAQKIEESTPLLYKCVGGDTRESLRLLEGNFFSSAVYLYILYTDSFSSWDRARKGAGTRGGLTGSPRSRLFRVSQVFFYYSVVDVQLLN